MNKQRKGEILHQRRLTLQQERKRLMAALRRARRHDKQERFETLQSQLDAVDTMIRGLWTREIDAAHAKDKKAR